MDKSGSDATMGLTVRKSADTCDVPGPTVRRPSETAVKHSGSLSSLDKHSGSVDIASSDTSKQDVPGPTVRRPGDTTVTSSFTR